MSDNKHGGHRAGAGRPAVKTRRKATSVSLSPWVRDALAGRAESMSQLVEAALIDHYKLKRPANDND